MFASPGSGFARPLRQAVKLNANDHLAPKFTLAVGAQSEEINVTEAPAWVRGRHTLKFGITGNRYEKTENAAGNNYGTFTFSTTPRGSNPGPTPDRLPSSNRYTDDNTRR